MNFLIVPLFALILGARTDYRTHFPWLALTLFIWFLWLLTRRNFLLHVGITICSFLTGSQSAFASRPIENAVQDTVEILITENPDIRSDRIYLYGSITTGVLASKTVRLQSARYPVIQNGELLNVAGTFTPARDFLRFLGIAAEIKCKDPPKRLGQSAPSRNIFSESRSAIEHKINENLPEPESSFLSGLLLGSKRAIPTSVQQDMQATSTSHLVAISGANVTFLLSFVALLFPLSRAWQKAALTTGIAVGLSLLTGSSSSVVRGAIMAAIPAWIVTCGRPVHNLTVVFITAYCMLLCNPLIFWYDSGFQLSFGAFLGVAYLQPFIGKIFRLVPESIQSSLPFRTLVETGAASLGTAPILYLHGNTPLTLLGLIANPLVLWIVPLASILGVAYLCTCFLPYMGDFLSQLAWVPLHTILMLIHQTALLNA